MTGDSGITFVLTSCGRFDLLHETLASFLAFNTAPIARFVVVEDSGDAAVGDVLARFDVDFDLLLNSPPCGQMRSIDRGYARVETPYIFHCEDDWRFFRRGFVEDSLRVLERSARASVVVCRRTGQNPIHDALVAATAVECVGGVAIRFPPVDADATWGGYSMNPGLRRLSDCRRLGSFQRWGSEAAASLWFKREGMGIGILESPACETTGRERHVRDAFAEAALPSLHEHADRRDGYGGVARNAPCPCGSGNRYKHCHGSAAGG